MIASTRTSGFSNAAAAHGGWRYVKSWPASAPRRPTVLIGPAAPLVSKWEFEKAHHRIEVSVEGPLIFDDEGMVVEAALAGVGLGYVIEEQVASLLQAGELVRVLEDWCPPFPGFFLYYPGRRQLSPALAAFIDAIRVPARRERRR